MIPKLRAGPGLRGRLLLSVLAAVALVLVALIAAFNLVLRERLQHEVNNALVARSSAELAAVRRSGTRLSVPEINDAAAIDGQAWVFANGSALEQPRTSIANERAARALSNASGRRSLDVAATDMRLYAVPIVIDGQRRGTVVAAVSLRPYEHTRQIALVASIILGLVVLLVVGVAARLLIGGALRPVGRMTAQAAEWSDIHSGRRFNLGPPRDELTQLAATLDRLLDRVASSFRHEQRFSAELSHELRTPLANVIAEAQLGLRHASTAAEYRAGYEGVLASAQQMRRTLETLLVAARAESDRTRGTGDAFTAARAAADGCTAVAAERHVVVDVSRPARPVTIGVDTDVAERVLAPLIENGCRYGSRKVTVTIEVKNGAALFMVADDGPGLAAAERETIFNPGSRGAATRTARRDGAGLGLSLARRLARAAGGDIRAEPNGIGARFTAQLPSA